MGGMADGGQTAGQDALSDLVTVREAAQAAGVMPSMVHSWIKRGRLAAQPGAGVRLVSQAAVQALVPPPDPPVPADAVAIYEAMRLTDVTRRHIETWVTQGRLPSWRGRYGMVVRVADVQNLAQQRAMAAAAGRGSMPLPADARLIREAARLAGVDTGRLYSWIKRGLLPVWPGTGTGQRVRQADVLALSFSQGQGLPLQPGGAP